MATQFGQNIRIDGNSLPEAQQRTYEAAVNDELLGIMMFQTGAAVIREIWGCGHRTLRITPWTGRQDNADAAPTNWRAATAPGQAQYDDHGRVHRDWGRGTGTGSSVHIRYSPSRFGSDSRIYFLERNARFLWLAFAGEARNAPGSDQGEVLLHEMVHALGMMLGRHTGSSPMGGQWDTEDEFRAILVANVYSSERGRPLRRTHAPGVLFDNPGSWSASAAFTTLFNSFVRALPGLARRLQSVQTEFNPFLGLFGVTQSMR